MPQPTTPTTAPDTEPTSTPVTPGEITSVFSTLGLATAEDRARFDAFRPTPALANFDVVITTTSEPFKR